MIFESRDGYVLVECLLKGGLMFVSPLYLKFCVNDGLVLCWNSIICSGAIIITGCVVLLVLTCLLYNALFY